MKDIQLTINKLNVYDEVAKTSSYDGAKADSEGLLYSKVFTTDEDRMMLERFWVEACSIITDELKDFIKTVTEQNPSHCVELEKNYDVTLNMTDRYDSNLTPSVKASLFSYFVNYILSKWYAIAHKEESERYAANAAGALDEALKMVYHKTKPKRKPIIAE